MPSARKAGAGRLLNVLALAVTAAACLPYLLAARYAIFHSDDYAFCVGTFAEPSRHLLADSLRRAWSSYTSWQGTFVPNILNPLFDPLNWHSYAVLRLILIACLAAVFLAALLLCREIARLHALEGKTGILFACLLLPLLAFADYADPVLWYVGAMAYMVPLLFLILGLALTLRALRTRSAGACGFACLLLFLSGGGTLLNGALSACLTLTLLLALLLETKRLDPVCLRAFLSALAGDLVNVLAPGNYVKSGIGGISALLEAVKNAFVFTAGRYGAFFSRPVFLLALLAALLLGLRAAKKLRASSFALVVFALSLTPFVVAFPYVLGYHVQSEEFLAGRAFFMIDIALVVCWETVAFQLGGRLRGLVAEKNEKLLLRSASVLAALLLILGLPAAGSCTPVQVTKNLRNGEIASYAGAWWEIMHGLEERPGEVVVIYEQPESCVGVYPFRLNAWPDNPTNVHVARYYGNKYIVNGWYEANYGLDGLEN